MTEDELRDFAAQVRAECDAALARMATVDPAGLPPDLRALTQDERWLCTKLRLSSPGAS
jgi:hypothetical protein